MAAQSQVKKYLAYWLQLGKGVCLQDGRIIQRPQNILQGDGYSQEFEACWQQVRSPASGECYLEGTEQTIEQLLTDQWDIIGCGRCAMPMPVPVAGIASPACPCHDLPSWPNLELPQPRSPVNTTDHLQGIRQRLLDAQS